MTSEVEYRPDLADRVLSAISSVNWTSSLPADQLPHYLTQGARSTRISTFGPTPASEAVLMRAHLTATPEGPVIKGQCQHQLSEMGKTLMRDLDDVQLMHRSRPYGVMSNRLQMNEFNRRWKKARQNRDVLSSLILPTSLAEELNSIKQHALLKRMTVDLDHIERYIKDHEKSSVVSGVKWDALPRDRGFWNNFMNEVKGGLEEYAFNGYAFDSPFNLGSRQRTGGQTERDVNIYDIDENRTRVVCFHPALSSVYAFVPDKKAMYKEIMDNAKDVFDISDHFMTPVVDGGEVYGAAAEALHNSEDVVIVLGDDCNVYNNGTQYAFDGVNWETQVGTILGDPLRGSKTYFGGMYHVPSGVWDTTIDDTLATMHVYSLERENMRKGEGINGIMERELMDEKCNFMLGLSYNHDPNAPRLQGLKMTQDKSDASHILPSGRNLEIKSKHLDIESEYWFLAYYGTTPDGGTLLDFLQDISPEEFRSGVMDQIIMQQANSEA